MGEDAVESGEPECRLKPSELPADVGMTVGWGSLGRYPAEA